MTVIKNLVVIGDTHAGCQFALCPPGVRLDGGGVYYASKYQQALWDYWQHFWRVWVPKATRGEDYAVCINGDLIDGKHHNSVSQITQNLRDQRNIADAIISPIIEKCKGQLYVTRGTPVHAGESGQDDETVAKFLGAIPDENGHHARNDLWIKVGDGLAHITHHIGTTGSVAYETTALMKEYSEACAQSGMWGLPSPDVVVRSHRHRHSEVRVPSANGYGVCFTTAAWQLKTPFVWRIPGGRNSIPQIGGSLIRQGDEEFYTRHKTWTMDRTETVKPVVGG